MVMKYFLQPMSEKESSEVEILIKNCQERIKSYFENEFEYNQLPVPRSNEFLRQHISEKLPLFVLYVDLIGSTQMSSTLSPDILTFIIRAFCQEMAYIIEHYGGYVLKFVGDAAIGYFLAGDKPGLVAEKTTECGTSMITVIENALNPVLKRKGYTELKVKVTAGFGIASVILYSADKSKAHVDIIGLSLNLAAKMQSIAKPNQIVIGEQIYDRLNSKLKTLFQRVDADTTGWSYKIPNGKSYSIYACSPKVS
jgi:class 3 adenylate cyclase